MPTFHHEPVYLPVVVVDAGVLERVQGGLQDVVQVAAPLVRREHLNHHRQASSTEPSPRPLLDHGPDDRGSVCSPRVADVHAPPVRPPVGIHRWRERQGESHTKSRPGLPSAWVNAMRNPWSPGPCLAIEKNNPPHHRMPSHLGRLLRRGPARQDKSSGVGDAVSELVVAPDPQHRGSSVLLHHRGSVLPSPC